MTDPTKYPPIKLGSPGEDISKKDLQSIIKRFKNLNQLRLQRVQSFFQTRQQIFLDILPLLFHQNHPLLPGFTSSETAAGLPDYIPNKKAIHAAKQFSKSFTYKRKALLTHPIQGIFLMGSVGSIAFSKTSDMDIWLCHQPSLVADQIDELQQKAIEIEQWADSLGLEVHFFLVNSESFSKGENIPISSESSGNTQHYLLLEEFYRTAIFIAGRTPAWWLIPPNQEYNYTEYLAHLIENRFISENEVIDFGGLATIPAEEFISATLWHIYKSLNSPHKSLLKLFLMESYASEYPKPKWLCFDLKQAIYQGAINIDKLDPYLLIYAKVEHYLQKNQSTHRLNLARQCFYLKIMGGSSRELDYSARVFREAYIQNIAVQWNWPADLLSSLHKQKFWDISKAIKEHIIVRIQLKNCLRMILKLAGQYVKYNYRENQDLKLLSRKLHVSLERKPGKIEIITTRAAVHTQENELSIIETSNPPPIWSLYSGQYDSKKPLLNKLIKQQSSLIELLVWLVVNGLYNKHLQLSFISDSLSISRSELHQVLAKLFIFISNNQTNQSSSLDIYNKPNKITASLNIINLGLSHLLEREDGMIVLSERSDPLSYGKNKYCFIHHIDRISLSSWGEISTYQYQGADGFFSCINQIVNSSQQSLTKNCLKTLCFTPTRANSIVLRSNSIFENLINYFIHQKKPGITRYFLPGEHLNYVFQKRNKQLQYWTFETEEQLFQELSKPLNEFGRVIFDDGVFNSPLIPYLYSLNKKNTIQIFYLSENNSITIFVIDEFGALFTQQHTHASYSQVLNNYLLFLETVSNHFFQQTSPQLKLYKINKNSAVDYSVQTEKWKAPTIFSDLSIRVIVEEQEEPPRSSYFIYCNDIEFSTINHADQLFNKVAHYINNFRSSTENYPIYISDIDISRSLLSETDENQLQTIHYLNYKKRIEAKLNS